MLLRAAGVRAECGGPGNDRRAALDKLLGALKTAPSEEIAGPLEQQIRQLWLNAGTPAVTLLMSRGLREMKADAQAGRDRGLLRGDHAGSERWRRPITSAPSRASPPATRQGAIADLQATLQREPRSFAAFADAGGDRRGAQGLEGRL